MADKQAKKSGIGDPNVKGVDGLFTVSEQPKMDTNSDKKKALNNKVHSVGPQREKRTWTFSEQTLDFLHQMKPIARREANRSVSYGELVDRAVYELAIKMGLVE